MKTELIKNVFVTLGRAAGAGLLVVLPRIAKANIVAETDEYSDGYYDAVKVIMGSDMFDSSKRECVSAMKKNASPAYYQTVIEIIESDMFDSTKIDTIESL